MAKIQSISSGLILTFILSNCAPVGPDYIPPEFQPSVNYKSSTSNHFGVSSSWWKKFRDPKLNSLQSQLLSQNLDLSTAYTRRQQTLTKLGAIKSNTTPKVSALGSTQRQKTSRAGSDPTPNEYFTQHQVHANLSYEIDLWGRVRRLIQSGKAEAQASSFLVEDVKVSLQTQLAQQYFVLRFLDTEMTTLAAAVKTRQQNVKITRERLKAGLATELDTSRANSELANAQAELLSLKGPRAKLENSIALLIGKQASQFRINPLNYSGHLPSIPAGMPAALLYRRPDVAVAERKLAAATARIGIAESKRYPTLSLTGSSGSTSISTSKFLEWSSRNFSLGPSVSVPIFQGGLIKSNILLSKAERDEALANYQNTTLSAIADVESSLATLQALKAEATARNESVKSTSRTYELSLLRYKEGATNYLDVADAQREKLTSKRLSVRTRSKQFKTTVQLIQALGGGFSRKQK